ncbi:ankyrin repeat domain-containing protein [Mesonia sediminis]|uniref:Ankyrin repeat domain-containing protein n=1 Tax=Mesonia sediminis TaxID=1703946 RepID=A0ABW5SCF5_9FLAO
MQSIFIAAKNNNTLKIKKLTERNSSINLRNEQQQTPLMVATYNNNIEAAKLLIKPGADVNAQDNRLETPILHAGAAGYYEILNACLGTDNVNFLKLNRYGGTALIPACERGHVKIVKRLLKIENFPVDHINNLGWTALLVTVILGDGTQKYIDIVQMLIEAGCNIYIADKDGVTALEHAQKSGFTEMVNLLKANG